MYTKITRFVSLCLLLMLTVTGVASAAPMTSTSNTSTMPQAQSSGVQAAENEVQPGISPTTGLNTGSSLYRPVLVQISNAAAARPHWNMSEADIVYEMIYWGPAHTRYTAVYNDNHPTEVNSIRSARVANCEIRQEWDAPLVFYGGQDMEGSSIYDFFSQYNVPTSFRFDGVAKDRAGVFSRTTERQNPHNAVANLQAVLAAWPTDESGAAYEPQVHAFRFSQTPTQGADSAIEVHIPYDQQDFYPSYTYNAAERVYERWYNGTEMYDGRSGKRIVASNVIVQYAPLTFVNNSRQRPLINTVGSGVMDAFIDGRHIRGTWSKSEMNDRTVFMDANGEEITLLPGKTFIQILPLSMSYTYVRSDGSDIELTSGVSVAEPEFDPSETDEDMDNMDAGEGE